MSHFCGIVFGNNLEVLEKYDENLEVPEYIDKTPKELLEWAKDYELRIRDTIAKYENSNNTYEIERAEELRKELASYNHFESKDDYVKLYSKYHKLDEHGNAVSTYNPDSKWDWYTIGGRWNEEMIQVGECCVNQAYKSEITSIKTPFCFIDTEGEWHEHGSMGWWGCADYGDKTKSDWEKEFKDYLVSVPGDTLLTLIDFHI